MTPPRGQQRLPSFLNLFQKVLQWNVLQAAHRRLWEASLVPQAGPLETAEVSQKGIQIPLHPRVKRSPNTLAASKCPVWMKAVRAPGCAREALAHSTPQLSQHALLRGSCPSNFSSLLCLTFLPLAFLLPQLSFFCKAFFFWGGR